MLPDIFIGLPVNWTFIGLYETNENAVTYVTLCVCVGKPELRAEVDIIVADVGEPDSLAAMCKQAVIVLNCVGPVS